MEVTAYVNRLRQFIHLEEKVEFLFLHETPNVKLLDMRPNF